MGINKTLKDEATNKKTSAHFFSTTEPNRESNFRGQQFFNKKKFFLKNTGAKMSSHMVQSFSNNSRYRTSQQFSPLPPTRSIQASVSPVQQPHYDPAQLIADQTIDPALLLHENPNHCTDLAPQLPLNKYRLNVDQHPHVVRRKPQEKVHYLQQVAVRYLKPPPPPKAGDVVIRQMVKYNMSK